MCSLPSKQSEQELRPLVQAAVEEACGLPRRGLWLCVDAVEPSGRPPVRLRVWATLHFLPEGSPFCCGEPGCHLGLFGERLAEVAEHVQKAMGLQQPVTVEFDDRIAVQYHPGTQFQSHRP